jgi:hypothetical protein
LSNCLCTKKAWERGKRCNDYTLETFRRNPVGKQSHPVEPGRQPEASLAWAGVTRTAKRRQPGPRPCYGAPRVLPAASPRLGQHGGRVGTPQRPGVSGPAGVEEHGIGPPGFSRNLGRPVHSYSSAIGSGGCQTAKLLAPDRRRVGAEGRTQTHGEGIGTRTARKCAETMAGNRSAP